MVRGLEPLRIHHAALTRVHAHVSRILARVRHRGHERVAEVRARPALLHGLRVWIRHALHETALARVRHLHTGEKRIIVSALLCICIGVSDIVLRCFVLVLHGSRCGGVLGHAGWLLILVLTSAIVLAGSQSCTFADLHRCFDHFLSLNHLGDFLLEGARRLSNDDFLHELFSLDVFDFPGLLPLVYFLDSSEIAIAAFAPELLFNMRPSLKWFPLSLELRVTDDVVELPVVFQVGFVGNVVF